jgi:predicted nucleic acid-binding protein
LRQSAVNSIVLDTSVAFKWFHDEDEEHVETALIVRDAFLNGTLPIAVPDLLVHELLNALSSTAGKSRTETQMAALDFWSLGLDVIPFDIDLSMLALAISYDLGMTAYDASYVALAESRQALLVTADGDMVKKAVNRIPVTHLADFQ